MELCAIEHLRAVVPDVDYESIGWSHAPEPIDNVGNTVVRLYWISAPRKRARISWPQYAARRIVSATTLKLISESTIQRLCGCCELIVASLYGLGKGPGHINGRGDTVAFDLRTLRADIGCYRHN